MGLKHGRNDHDAIYIYICVVAIGMRFFTVFFQQRNMHDCLTMIESCDVITAAPVYIYHGVSMENSVTGGWLLAFIRGLCPLSFR